MLPSQDKPERHTHRPAEITVVSCCLCDSPAEAPDVAKARMYKVLKEVVEENQQGSQGTSTVARLVLVPVPSV